METFYKPDTCAECREPFGDGEDSGVYETPAGVMCAECYGMWQTEPYRAREEEVRWMWEMYNAGVNGGEYEAF